MNRYSPGDSVTVTEGPLKGLFAIIVMFDDDQQKYLVRFGSLQQMFYPEDEVIPWSQEH